MKMWSGRFRQPLDPHFEEWQRSFPFDQKLLHFELAASGAHAQALKAAGSLPRRVQLRQCKYLNNVIEQDHRNVKKRAWLAKGYGSFQSAWRTLQDIETST